MEGPLGETTELYTVAAPSAATAPPRGPAENGDTAGHWRQAAPVKKTPRPSGRRHSPRRSLLLRCFLLYWLLNFAAWKKTDAQQKDKRTTGESRPSTPGTRTATPSSPTRCSSTRTSGRTPASAAPPTASAPPKRNHGECGEGERTTSGPARLPTTSCRTAMREPRRWSAACGRADEQWRTRSGDRRAVLLDAERHEWSPRSRRRSRNVTSRNRTTMARARGLGTAAQSAPKLGDY